MSEQLALLIPVLALSSTLLLSTTLSTLLTVLFTVALAAALAARFTTLSTFAALFVVFVSSSVVRDSIFRFLVATTSAVFCWLLSLSELNLAAVRVCAVG